MASPGAGELLDPLLESLGQGEHFRAECRSLLDKICALVPSAGALMQGLGPSANEPAEDEFRRLQCATAIWAMSWPGWASAPSLWGPMISLCTIMSSSGVY